MARTQDSPRKNARRAGTQTDSIISPTTKAAQQSKHAHKAQDAVSESEQPAPSKKPKTIVRKATGSYEAHDARVVELESAPAKKSTVRKRPREADDTAVVELEPPALGKKAKITVSKAKRQREDDDAVVKDSEQVAPTKKVKTAPTNTKKTDTQQPEGPGGRRSSRTQTKTPKATTAKRARRTKDEIAADKAKAEAEKRRQQQLTEENHKEMIRMDANEDINRAETAARAIRTFTDLDRDSGGEEFTGYDEVSSGEDSDIDDESDDGYSEDAATLKVRFPSCLKSVGCSTYPTS